MGHRSRLLPGGEPVSGHPGPITRARVIDISARHREREVGVLLGHLRGTRRPLRTELGSADQTARTPRDVRPVPKRESVTSRACLLLDAHEAVDAAGVDGLQPGQIHQQTRGRQRSRVQLVVNQRRRRSVKCAAQPEDRLVWPALPAKDELPCHRPVRRVDGRGCRDPSRTVACRFVLAMKVHTHSRRQPIDETVTRGRSDSRLRASPGFERRDSAQRHCRQRVTGGDAVSQASRPDFRQTGIKHCTNLHKWQVQPPLPDRFAKPGPRLRSSCAV